MAVYVGHDECRVIYVARNGQQLRVSSVWVGDHQVFPPADRQEIHLFTRDTQGYGRVDNGTHFAFTVPVPWWATSMDVVVLGAGEKGRDGTKSFTGGTNGNGGRSGAWVVKTIALTQSADAAVNVGKGTSTAPHATEIILPGVGGQADVRVHDGEGTRTPNNGSTGGSVTPLTRTEYNQIHTGARGATLNYAGSHPGDGGGGGSGSGLIGNPKPGQPGGDGYVWLRFRSAPALDPGDVLILRVGVTSGFAYAPLREWAASTGKTYTTITEITVPLMVVGPSLYSLFYDCRSLTSAPELDTSQVTNMQSMFDRCLSLTAIPELDTSNATGMGSMFAYCSSLASVPELDTSQVTSMPGMFYGCSALESVTLPGMGNAFTAKRTLNMWDTKLNAAAANALMQSLGTPSPGGNLQLPATATGADTSIATAKNWTVTVGDESSVLRVGVTSGFAYTPLRNWAVSTGKTHETITGITVPMEIIGPSLNALFADCSSLTSAPELDTSQVTNMQYMFYVCQALTSVPELNTGNVKSMYAMFYDCRSLTTIPDLDTSQVTNMQSMFDGCRALTSVPELDTSQVANMGYMFYDCEALTSIPALDTSQVKDTEAMFSNCSALESVTLPGMGNAFTAKRTLDMKATKLNPAAANALMQSLGAPPPGGNLQLPATSAGADTSIAAAKNWTVTTG